MLDEIMIDNLPKHIGVTSAKLTGLKKVTVLLGKNGSGKSEILRKIALSKPESRHYCNPEKAGQFQYNVNYFEQELRPDRTNHRNMNVNVSYYSEVMTRLQVFFAKRGAWVDGQAPVSHIDLQQDLRILFPDRDIQLTTEHPFFRVEGITHPDTMSSGERQILGLGLDILTIAGIWRLENKTDCILLIDEPDAHLHPDFQIYLALFLKKVADRFPIQLLVATHSTTLMAALGHCFQSEASIIYLARGEGNYRAIEFNKVHKELTSLLGGHALMGPLFGVPLLLVEGDDDYRVWSQVPRHHKFRFSVLPCNGDEIFNFQKTLEQIFLSLLSQSGNASAFVLVDGDKKRQQVEKQSHVRLLHLGCHEAENLYLADEVLSSMGLTWEGAKTKIKAEASGFGTKSETLKSVNDWDRKYCDIKTVINELSAILDPKRVHWTTRVGQVIGRGHLGAQLRDFLGVEVVDWLLQNQIG